MKIQTKIIMFVIIVILAVVVGLIINLQGFTKIQEEQKKDSPETESSNKKLQDPVLELTQEEVSIEVGATFSYKDFIKKAEDENGYNLKDKVNAPKEFPTDLPGEYQIEYTLELSNGEKITKLLKLKVIEYDLGTNSD